MPSSILNLNSPPGYTSIVGTLVSQLNVAKFVITRKIKNLSRRELDASIANHANSIGTLLKHMIAVEKQFQSILFLNRDLNNEEISFWKGVLPTEHEFVQQAGYDIEYYLSLWDEVRNFTVKKLRGVDDDWLYKHPISEFASLGNNYYCIFHVLEDQLCHYGQIRAMLKVLQKKVKE